MRDGNAAGNAGCGLLLTGEGVGKQAFDLRRAAGLCNELRQVADDGGGVSAEIGVKKHQIIVDEGCHVSSLRVGSAPSR